MKTRNMPGRVARRRARALAIKNDRPMPADTRGIVDMSSRLGRDRRAANGAPTVETWEPKPKRTPYGPGRAE